MSELNDLTQAIQLRNWYAVAALVLTLLIQVVRKAPILRDAWAKIPNGWRWLVPILSGGVTGFVDAYNSGLPLGAAAVATLGGALGIGLGAMGLNAALTESHLPWNGGAGGIPKDTRYTDTLPPPPKPPSGIGFSGGMAAMIAALVLLVCCGGSTPPPGTVQTLAPLVCQTALMQDKRFDADQVARICADSALAAKLGEELTRIVLAAADEALQPKLEQVPSASGSSDGGSTGASSASAAAGNQ
ncbi:MAG TPA: hypothetical protein VG734_25795 [Lacunisphaera sp.]|nr:hypothetical protein [Lacunisphaera sp.]